MAARQTLVRGCRRRRNRCLQLSGLRPYVRICPICRHPPRARIHGRRLACGADAISTPPAGRHALMMVPTAAAFRCVPLPFTPGRSLQPMVVLLAGVVLGRSWVCSARAHRASRGPAGPRRLRCCLRSGAARPHGRISSQLPVLRVGGRSARAPPRSALPTSVVAMAAGLAVVLPAASSSRCSRAQHRSLGAGVQVLPFVVADVIKLPGSRNHACW
jgi:hypothetical protein